MTVASEVRTRAVRAIPASRILELVPALSLLLRDSVNEGASLGFLPPVTREACNEYWLSLRPEMRARRRMLLAAFDAERLVGCGQLSLPTASNGLHRAEIQKLVVAGPWRGRGVGRALMDALHEAARDHGRSLIILHTRQGEAPERFYRELGYRDAGVVPGYTVGPAGERYDSLRLYREIYG